MTKRVIAFARRFFRRDDDSVVRASAGSGAVCLVADCVHYEPALLRHRIERELHRAIARGEFEMHYQPILDIATGRVTACEALLRWRHPERGRLLPAEFIDVAAERGLLSLVGYWGIEQACADAARWQTAGMDGVRVAVNVSPSQLPDPDLIAVVESALTRSGLSPALLEVEVTEDAGIHVVGASETLNALRAIGAHVTLDDFGVGYASIASVQRVPASRLKIDRSFITDLARRPIDAAIVRGIIAIARTVGMVVVAEGVEEEEQLEFLRDAGCDEVQGWLFGPAVSAKDLPGFVRELAGRWPPLRESSAECSCRPKNVAEPAVS